MESAMLRVLLLVISALSASLIILLSCPIRIYSILSTESLGYTRTKMKYTYTTVTSTAVFRKNSFYRTCVLKHPAGFDSAVALIAVSFRDSANAPCFKAPKKAEHCRWRATACIATYPVHTAWRHRGSHAVTGARRAVVNKRAAAARFPCSWVEVIDQVRGGRCAPDDEPFTESVNRCHRFPAVTDVMETDSVRRTEPAEEGGARFTLR